MFDIFSLIESKESQEKDYLLDLELTNEILDNVEESKRQIDKQFEKLRTDFRHIDFIGIITLKNSFHFLESNIIATYILDSLIVFYITNFEFLYNHWKIGHWAMKTTFDLLMTNFEHFDGLDPLVKRIFFEGSFLRLLLTCNDDGDSQSEIYLAVHKFLVLLGREPLPSSYKVMIESFLVDEKNNNNFYRDHIVDMYSKIQ